MSTYENLRADIHRGVETIRFSETANVEAAKRVEYLNIVANKTGGLVFELDAIMSGGDENKGLIQDLFFLRKSMEQVYNKNNGPNANFPASYEILKRLTHDIQEIRKAREAQATTQVATEDVKVAPGGSASNGSAAVAPIATAISNTALNGIPQGLKFEKSKPRRKVIKSSEMVIDLSDDESPAKVGSKDDGEKMNVDDENPKAPKRAGSPAPVKRARVKRAKASEADPVLAQAVPISNTFNEASFLTASAANFFASGMDTEALVKRAEEVLTLPDPNLAKDPLAVKKRMYYIMVEVACIHEAIRSALAHRTNLINEGAHLVQVLDKLPADRTGLDNIVP
ncbi:hypothetical protein MKEN_00978700 [Mycena kentingensis (nom. inval.)]|nr:hypothetical protein MKEN_00978700 [Mycena kentingensis (nom. inval.)]